MRISILLAFVSAMCLSILSVPAHAQATRTWVSGVGDDVNPCSRTAPCKTFAGAISKTTSAGEINCLDPGGFGAVTITKSIIISCEIGTAGVLVSGTNGIVVSVTSSDTVYLRGLDIEGLTTGLVGINFIGGGALHVEKCLIRGFNAGAALGLGFSPNSAASLFVSDTVVTENGNSSAVTGGGILIAPSGAGTASASLTSVKMLHNATFGLRVQDNGKATVFNSVASGNGHNGFLAASTSSPAAIELTHSVTANNGTNGIATSGGNATIHIAYTSIFDNTTGINTAAGGSVTSFSPATNANAGNGTPGAPNGAAIGLQ